MSTPTPATLRTRLVGLGATLVVLGIVAGLPIVLLALDANPVPHSLTSLGGLRNALSSPDDGTLALGAVKVIAWAAWGFLTGSILLEVAARLRGAHPPRLPGLALPQSAAHGLVAAALLLIVTAPVAAPAARAAATDAVRATNTTTAPGPTSAGQHSQTFNANNANDADDADDASRRDRIASRNTHNPYTVRAGDTLSQIAEDHLGDATRYPEIFTASRHITQPGGAHLSDPDLIDVGWTLSIPGHSGPRDHNQRQAPERRLAGGSAEAPHDGDPGASAVAPAPGADQPTATDTSAAAAAPRADQHEERGNAEQQPSSAHAAEVADSEDDPAPWTLTGLTGGGAVLAGSLWLTLRTRRRAQFRARRPGRTIATPPPVLAPVEKTITAVGAATAPTVEWMDGCLRRLAAAQTARREPMPELAAVEIRRHGLVLHLSAPATLDKPWAAPAPGQLHWSLPATADLDAVGPVVDDQPAPYPLLVTIGVGDDDEVWLLNCEDLNLAITGDETFGRDFARYLAAELACNPWSHGVRVDCVGVAEEVAAMNPDRIRAYPSQPDAGQPDPAAAALADAVTVVDRCAEVGTDTATARAAQAGADAWPARLLLVDAAATDRTPALDQLLTLVDQHAGQTGTSVVVHGPRDTAAGVELHVTAAGRVTLPHARLDLVAVGLTSDEAQGCAALLAASENLDDAAMPVDPDAAEGWRAFTDQAGALREEHTLPRQHLRGRPESVLEHDDEDYLARAATTAEDLDALAPRVPDRVRAEVERADPTLDDDVAAWFAEDCPLPRLTLLGPVHARTRGTPVTKRKPYYTEILAYLATRPHGATPEELAAAFGITAAKSRDYVAIVRDWLGINPRTGGKHLPEARQAPAAKARGVGVYQVIDLLCDADLFRRLRVRGEARGPDGIHDLRTALRLVKGRPFDKLRDGGWSWLSEGDRLDQHMTCALVDVAHLVTTHSLQAGDLKQARLVAENALLAAPDEEIPRLDLAAVAAAEGHHGEAERILRDQVANRTDDEGAPPELPDRTQRIIAARGWLPRDKEAS